MKCYFNYLVLLYFLLAVHIIQKAINSSFELLKIGLYRALTIIMIKHLIP